MKKKEDRLSVFISLILRHKPEVINISLDEYGFAKTNELIPGINSTGREINFDVLKRIVDSDEKHRYSFSEDFSRIRANQGHSLTLNVEMQAAIPPDFLFHGTSEETLPAILQEGIKKMSRQYVHLSELSSTAVSVGKRHGLPVVLVVNSREMYNDGVEFKVSENGIWQVENVPTKYISIKEK